MSPFPRSTDDLPHAWGLMHDIPTEIWERFSPAYEAQAEAVWAAFAEMGLVPALEWAGSQDGEAIIARRMMTKPGRDAEIVILFHLENPQEAQRVQTAIETGRLAALIADEIRESEDAVARSRREDAVDSRRTRKNPTVS